MTFKKTFYFIFSLLLVSNQNFGQDKLPLLEFEEIVIAQDDGLQSWENLDLIYEDKEGIFWTVINEGLFRYNGHTAINISAFLSKNYNLDLDNQTNTTFLKKDSILWLGRRKSLLKINLNKLSYQEVFLDTAIHTSNYRNLISRMKSVNDTLYVGTGNGLYLLDERSLKIHKKYLNNGIEINHRESSNAVQSIYPDIEANAIWVALNNGLYRIDKRTDHIEHYTLPSEVWDNKHHFHQGHRYGDNLLMPGFGSGLVEFNLKTRSFTRYYNTKKPENEALEMGLDKYWFSNIIRSEFSINDSISLVSFQGIGNAYFNRNTKDFTYLDTPEDMKKGVFFNVDRNGYLWASKIGRLWRSKVPVIPVSQPFQHIIDISSFQVNNTTRKRPNIEGYDDILVKEERNIKLEFTLSKAYLYDSIQYQYRLNNKKWIPVTKPNTIDLPKLKYKNYTLSIRALDKENNVVASRDLGFRLTIPFYKTLYFMILCFFILFGTAFLISQYFQSKKTAKKLLELDELKSSFFANVSHEFRTPLALISGPIEEQLQKDNLSDKEKKNLQIAQYNSKRLLDLVDQLLDLSKLESGSKHLKVVQGDLPLFLNSLFSAFSFLAESNNQNYVYDITGVKASNNWFDPDIVEKIINNIIGNAIKYSAQGESIEVTATLNNQNFLLTVTNTGTPLSTKQLTKIFDRFYSTNENITGTGIGLALTRELTLLHKGSIVAESSDNQVVFKINLPISKKSFSNTEISNDAFRPGKNIQISNTVEKNRPVNEDLTVLSQHEVPIILIVEDNKDLRHYITSLFDIDYKIYTAENGTKGFTIATEIVPDLIITDLMMPESDGITLTKNCKTSEITSHIPVIMLTAKAGEENELIGIETGADAYIIKPFNTKILRKTAENLINSRIKLRERYSHEIVLLPQDVTVNATDQRFLDKLKEIVDTKIIDSQFDVNQFATLLGMSRMQLHRKLKALTGQSATEFIRRQRLKLAEELLKKPEVNIAQVGYAVGFENPSYFTRCFKKYYGMSPSEFIKS
ncbi:helix-turn-helix domain-containing protein [Flavobacteriaceae bacterium R38]|nr:helix-turn-helix domain-containing protein [Flavobacteriaceae bacterium R38]